MEAAQRIAIGGSAVIGVSLVAETIKQTGRSVCFVCLLTCRWKKEQNLPKPSSHRAGGLCSSTSFHRQVVTCRTESIPCAHRIIYSATTHTGSSRLLRLSGLAAMNLSVTPTSWGFATPLLAPSPRLKIMAYYNRRRPLVIPLSGRRCYAIK